MSFGRKQLRRAKKQPSRSSSFLSWAGDEEGRSNREGTDDWTLYAGHRARITAAILEQASPTGGALCLLGAGNANDLDLAALASSFDEIRLVDIDPAALERAMARQAPTIRAKLRAYAPVDLSGLYQRLDQPDFSLDPFAAQTLIDDATASVIGQIPSDSERVVSGCVLTQMAWALKARLGKQHALAVKLQQIMAAVHLRTLVTLSAPGRSALLITDAISSRVHPLAELEAATDYRELLSRLTEQALVFQVANPVNLAKVLRWDPCLREQGTRAEVGEPWLWTGPKQVTFLVYPMTLERRAGG
jgi:hypothetical protein